MQPVTHIRSDEARQIHAQLIAALGTETVPNQWMIFMRTVREHLPAVLSQGRPSKTAIAVSPIGALGFDTWRSMCEAPVEKKGLGLPWSTWRQWSRAWAVVQKHPDLEQAPLTAAEVNRLATEAKSAGEPMPADKTAVEAFKKRQDERKAITRAETQMALKSRLEALQANLEAAKKEATQTSGVITELRRQLAQVEQQLADESERRQHYQWEMVQLESQVNSLKERNAYLEGEILLHQQGGLLKWLRTFFHLNKE